jgi:hypothetical protein
MFHCYIGGLLLDILINSDVIETYLINQDKKRYTFVRLTSTFMDLGIKNRSIGISPMKLPMICKPKEYYHF